MKNKTAQLLDALRRSSAPLNAKELGRRLGVTDRSIRNYVSSINASETTAVIESGPLGYQLTGSTKTIIVDRSGTPEARTTRILRSLIDARAGIDFHDLVNSLFVSDSTVEADLGRARSRIAGTGLQLQRTGDRIMLLGPETARRRVLSALFRDESDRDILELAEIQKEFQIENLASFKSGLISALESQQFTLNEFNLNNVLLHLVIAIDRVSNVQESVEAEWTINSSGEIHNQIKTILREQIESHVETALPDSELEYLAALIATRVATPDLAAGATISDYVEPERLIRIKEILSRASHEYLVDFSDENFTSRLALHLHNLINRAREQSYSRNPMTQSIKSSYPMIYELAVFVASELQQIENIEINEDEIAYIAMHIGAQMEQHRRAQALTTAVIVAPAYQDIPGKLYRSITQHFGSDIHVREVITRSEVHWDELNEDFVISTIESPIALANLVTVTPFFRDADVETVRNGLSRMRRISKRAQIVAQLRETFNPELFVRDLDAADAEDAIKKLGTLMLEQKIITPEYVAGAIERERMSSTAFTDSLAVPHAMSMTATKTSIALAVNEKPIQWGSSRVRVVAFIAFSESGRASFQEIFDQFVEVFSEEQNVARLVQHARDFGSFIEELTRLIDN